MTYESVCLGLQQNLSGEWRVSQTNNSIDLKYSKGDIGAQFKFKLYKKTLLNIHRIVEPKNKGHGTKFLKEVEEATQKSGIDQIIFDCIQGTPIPFSVQRNRVHAWLERNGYEQILKSEVQYPTKFDLLYRKEL